MTEKTEDELQKLLPEQDVKLSTGEALALKPFTFGQLPRAVKLLRPITDAVQTAGIATLDGADFMLSPDWPLRLPALMDEAGESLLAFVAFASGKPRDWFDTLGADDGIVLTKAVFEVNGDFFVKRVAPLFGLKAVPKVDGAPSSPA